MNKQDNNLMIIIGIFLFGLACLSMTLISYISNSIKLTVMCGSVGFFLSMMICVLLGYMYYWSD